MLGSEEAAASAGVTFAALSSRLPRGVKRSVLPAALQADVFARLQAFGKATGGASGADGDGGDDDDNNDDFFANVRIVGERTVVPSVTTAAGGASGAAGLLAASGAAGSLEPSRAAAAAPGLGALDLAVLGSEEEADAAIALAAQSVALPGGVQRSVLPAALQADVFARLQAFGRGGRDSGDCASDASDASDDDDDDFYASVPISGVPDGAALDTE